MTIQYKMPTSWIRYDGRAIVDELARARGAILSLTSIPYQEVLGGAASEHSTEARGGGDIENRRRGIHGARIGHRHFGGSTGPRSDQIAARHRGAEGGEECRTAFSQLCAAVAGEFRGHDPLIQALSLHYHLGAIHPFHDGNGRTARALEALVLQRARLKDDLFIAMSNYYNDEKDRYLSALSDCQKNGHDLTSFLRFGLHGVALQYMRLLGEINTEISKVLFRDVMHKMYSRLRSTRKRALAQRQMAILSVLLELPGTDIEELRLRGVGTYSSLKEPFKAYIRDLNYLIELNAIKVNKRDGNYYITARLEWPTEITETAFFKAINALPKAKTPLL